MHIHVLGICGTFMGSLAVLAREAGHRVSGSDANVYPPMSTQLEQQGIELCEGYLPEHLHDTPDLVVIGNALSRGNPAVEYVLEKGLEYCSGPEWLARFILPQKWVLAVAGTHGKTTTSAMLAWILEYAGLQPGFLIGGVMENFSVSARLGESPFFVVEADEYDSAFFDKRSKFVHYKPRTAILNNLEFDHADIFPDLASIQRQFHHLVRTVPSGGLIIAPAQDEAIDAVLGQGCWSALQRFTLANAQAHWQAVMQVEDGSRFTILLRESERLLSADVSWDLLGTHNVSNALAAVAAARHVGITLDVAAEALADFRGVKRRLELRGDIAGIRVYDDFAHHPTAIEATLAAMAARLGEASEPQRLIAVVEPRSNTMKMGVHQQRLLSSCARADISLWLQPPGEAIDLHALVQQSNASALVYDDTSAIIQYLVSHCRYGDHIVIMSNGGFDGIHQRLLTAIEQSQK